ncbi:MAG TPA: CAP domain-containing protein [Candidatus Acidoferrales bacterium]|nr:CAP domain-containing protein [Candidatus Acidoferrales bacterium]
MRVRGTAIGLLAIVFMGPPVARAQAVLSGDETQLLGLLNQERERAGLPKLEFNQQLNDAARNHTLQMVEHGQLSHQFPGEPALIDRVGATGLRFDSSGENVAYAPTVEDAHQDLMHSPLHRANILNPVYNIAGVSIMERRGLVYVTEDFAHSIPGYTVDQFREAFTAAFNKARAAEGRPMIAAQADSRLQKAACSNDPNLRELVNQMTGASDWVVFTSAEPEPLPAEILKAAADSTFRKMSVGVCSLPRKEHGFAGFRVITVFFMVH